MTKTPAFRKQLSADALYRTIVCFRQGCKTFWRPKPSGGGLRRGGAALVCWRAERASVQRLACARPITGAGAGATASCRALVLSRDGPYTPLRP